VSARAGPEKVDELQLFTLINAQGVEVRLSGFGASVLSIRTPDRTGALADIVLGLDDPAAYRKGVPYFGAVVGRYANRIGGAKFALDDVEYPLCANDGLHQLHGGKDGFFNVDWHGETFEDEHGQGVRFSRTSDDGEQGFPGEVAVAVLYQLTDDDILDVRFEATTTKATPINLSTHSYFNLCGDLSRDVTDHQLMIVADRFTPIDDDKIPTGELRAVAATPFDFRTPARIGARIGDDDEQLRFGRGYDHNWALNRSEGGGMATAAVLYEPDSGRELTVRTTEPGLHVYTGNHLDGTWRGKGAAITRRTGVCLETQHFPNAPNEPSFPSTILRPGEVFTSRTTFAFATRPS